MLLMLIADAFDDYHAAISQRCYFHAIAASLFAMPLPLRCCFSFFLSLFR